MFSMPRPAGELFWVRDGNADFNEQTRIAAVRAEVLLRGGWPATSAYFKGAWMSRKNFLYFWWQVLPPTLKYLATEEWLQDMLEHSGMFQTVLTDQYIPDQLEELYPDLIMGPADSHDLYIAVKSSLYEGLQTQVRQQILDERPWVVGP